MENNYDLMEHIVRLSRMVRRRPKGEHSVPHAGHKILHIVQNNDGIRTTDLAEKIGIRPASMTDALIRLEEEGYIIRKKSEHDSRAIQVYATEKAREQHRVWESASREQNERMLACLGADEIETFCSVCDKLCAFLETEYPQEHCGHRHGHGDAMHADTQVDSDQCPLCRNRCPLSDPQCHRGEEFAKNGKDPDGDITDAGHPGDAADGVKNRDSENGPRGNHFHEHKHDHNGPHDHGDGHGRHSGEWRD